MTQAQVKIGHVVVLAEHALTELLNDVLAQAGTDRQAWFSLSRVAAGRAALGGPPEQDNQNDMVRDDLSRAFHIDSGQAVQLLDRLVSEGLVAVHDEVVSLTPKGQALYEDVLRATQATTARLTETLRADDLETTARTLQAVTSRAREMHGEHGGLAAS